MKYKKGIVIDFDRKVQPLLYFEEEKDNIFWELNANCRSVKACNSMLMELNKVVTGVYDDDEGRVVEFWHEWSTNIAVFESQYPTTYIKNYLENINYEIDTLVLIELIQDFTNYLKTLSLEKIKDMVKTALIHLKQNLTKDSRGRYFYIANDNSIVVLGRIEVTHLEIEDFSTSLIIDEELFKE